MFPRKSNPNPSTQTGNTRKKNYSQYGLMDIGGLTEIGNDNFEDSDDDEDLEAELLALTSGNTPKPKPAAKQVVNPLVLDKMIKDSLRDVPSDEDLSSGEDDPSILAELEELQVGHADSNKDVKVNAYDTMNSVKSLLVDRLKMYEFAEQNAKSMADALKAKRIARGITTLKDLMKRADAGLPINEDDIPVAVSVAVPKRPVDETSTSPFHSALNEIPGERIPAVLQNIPAEPPPVPPRVLKHSSPVSKDVSDEPETKKATADEEDQVNSSIDSQNTSLGQDIAVIIQRQGQYKTAALNAKRSGDVQTALAYIKIVKQFDFVIDKVKEGAAIDLSSLPPPLHDIPVGNDISVTLIKSPSTLQKQESIQLTHSLPNSSDTSENLQGASSTPAADSYVAPKTVLEALEQRLKKYEESEEAAKNENNSSKVRRMGRIIKQYKDAIKLHKAGKPFPVDELPTPPGFAPIPVNDAPSKPAPTPSPQEPTADPPKVPEGKPHQPSPTLKNDKDRPSGQVTRNEKQLQIVLGRQKLFKLAALKAKQEGDLEAAKEYLRTAKGMDPMIEASHGGIPIDLSSLPLAPEEKKSLESDYEVIRLNDCIPGTDMEVYRKLISDLQQQLEMCVKTRDNFKTVGDVAAANRLEQLALRTKKDLKFVQLAEMNNLRIPKFHYETKPFTIVQRSIENLSDQSCQIQNLQSLVQSYNSPDEILECYEGFSKITVSNIRIPEQSLLCNADLTDNEVEVVIVQGINYNVPNPKEVDTYIKLFFPYPTETPQQFKSNVIYNTNNPVYDAVTKFNIQRNVRACQRIFKRHTLKCEIWSKGGFFRSDSLIGTVNAKLQPLETQCTIHDAFDLMDGRKTVGGKLELKIKIRDPILRKQIENVEEKWLIIDS